MIKGEFIKDGNVTTRCGDPDLILRCPHQKEGGRGVMFLEKCWGPSPGPGETLDCLDAPD